MNTRIKLVITKENIYKNNIGIHIKANLFQNGQDLSYEVEQSIERAENQIFPSVYVHTNNINQTVNSLETVLALYTNVDTIIKVA